MKNLWTRTVSALLLVLVGAACGRTQEPPQAAPTTVVDQAGYDVELRQNYSRLTWPPDYRPDLDRLIEATRPTSDERLPAGVTLTVLQVVDSCAWYLSWDAARSRADQAASERALQVMAGELTRFPPGEDLAGKQFVELVAERARAGDPALARQYVLANCDTTVWVPR
jgi:hypothetical protein